MRRSRRWRGAYDALVACALGAMAGAALLLLGAIGVTVVLIALGRTEM